MFRGEGREANSRRYGAGGRNGRGLLLAPGAAHAYEVHVSIAGSGTVDEDPALNQADLVYGGCYSDVRTPTGTVGADCYPGDPNGPYSYGWTVRWKATPSDGWEFVRWESDGSPKPVICDGANWSSTHTEQSCQFRTYDNLQTRAVFKDVTAPTAGITGGPAAGSTSGRSVDFDFGVTNHPAYQPVDYRCKLTGPNGVVRDWSQCDSEHGSSTYSSLSNGSHTSTVEAKDPSGNYTTASRTWNVDAIEPETTLTGDGPAEGSTVSSRNATFSWSGSPDTQKYLCRVDYGSVIDPCSSPRSVFSLADGTHTFFVWAQDTNGNVESSPARRTWTVDGTAPALNITGGPDGGSFAAGSTQTWNFSASDTGSGLDSVQCSVVASGAPENFGPCSGTASHSVSNLPIGSHTFSVRATDNVGLQTLKTRSFSIGPALRIADVRLREKTTTARFVVSLSAASDQSVTVNYATANGSAKAPADYTTTTGTLTFAPGSTTQTVPVPIRGDRRNERNEAFFVNLSGPTNATIADASGRGTIVDND